MKNSKIVIILLFISILAGAKDIEWRELKEGIYYSKNFYKFDTNRTVLLHTFKLKQNRFKIFIKSFHNLEKGKRVTLKNIREKNGYLITLSGGFYLPAKGYQSPQGLVIENGKLIFPIDKKLSGVVWIEDNYLILSKTEDIPIDNPKITYGIDYAIQGYPRIVDPINRVGIKSQGKIFHRTAICTQMKSDNIILFITDKKYDGISLLELAKLAQNRDKFNCKIGINLDGGPAPGISVSPKLINLEIEEGWQLPNMIIFGEHH